MNVQKVRDEITKHARGMWRFRWLALAVAWVVFMIGWFAVYSLPDQYSASAKVYVDTDSLMDPVFKDIALPNNLDAQIEAVGRALLTRPNLEAVATKTDLHLQAKSDEEMEGLITNLQDKIRVRGNNRSNVFDIEFQYADREKARDVVSALVDAFVENSLQEQGDDAQVTLQAVEAEIEQHNARLVEAEDRLAAFKKENVGYMPNDRGDYYSRLQTALADLDTTQSRIRALSERRAELARQLQAESNVLDELASSGNLAANCSQQSQIAELQTTLAALQVDFTDKHPRIVTLRENIAMLKERCSEEAAAARAAGIRHGAGGDGSTESNSLYDNLRMMQADADVELATLRAQQSEQQREVDSLRANVDKIADVEKNLKQLNRDYEVVQDRYQLLISRRENLRSKLRLDPVKDISFRILEPPFAANSPAGPPRPLFLAAVFVFAIGLGGAVALGLSEMNPVFYTSREITRSVGLPVLGSVSMLLNDKQAQARRRRNLLLAGGYAGLILLTAAAMVFHAEGANLLQDLLRNISA